MIHFIDLETSGTSDSDEVLECAVIAWDNGQRAELFHKHFFCQGIISPEAQKVNGYDQDTWWKKHDAQWLTAKYVGELAGVLMGADTIAGFSPAFQRRFLFSMFKRARMRYPFLGNTIDVVSLAAPLVVAGKLPSLSSDAILEAFGMARSVPGGDKALADCHNAITVFEKLTTLYWNGFK